MRKVIASNGILDQCDSIGWRAAQYGQKFKQDRNFKFATHCALDGHTILTMYTVISDLSSLRNTLAFPEIDVNLRCKNGDTALIVAVRNGWEDGVAALLEDPRTSLINLGPADAGEWAMFMSTKKG